MKNYNVMIDLVAKHSEHHDLKYDTICDILKDLPEAIKVYKRGYRQGWSYEAIKAEIKNRVNWSIGGWLYELAENFFEETN